MSMAFENVDYTSLDIPAAPFSDPARIPDFPKNKVPRHIGVIMDGNGRWAKQRGIDRKSTRLNSSHSTQSRMPSSA